MTIGRSGALVMYEVPYSKKKSFSSCLDAGIKKPTTYYATTKPKINKTPCKIIDQMRLYIRISLVRIYFLRIKLRPNAA